MAKPVDASWTKILAAKLAWVVWALSVLRFSVAPIEKRYVADALKSGRAWIERLLFLELDVDVVEVDVMAVGER